MLMDGMLGAKRTKPLTIVGPEGTEAHLSHVCEALFPGMHVMSPKFHLTYAEMPVMRKTEFDGFAVTSYPAMHTGTTNPTSVRVELEGKVVSYTGDSEWTRHMPDLARDADLFVCECYFYGRSIPHHMSYPDYQEHKHELSAKRTVLTHFSREMIPHKDDILEETAYDGKTLEV